MGSNDFEGSLAQRKIKYTIGVTNEVVVGDLFQSVVIFVKSSEAAANFVTAPGVGSFVLATPSSFASVAKGSLLQWLTDFYSVNQVTKIYLVEIDETTLATGLATALALFRAYGFFKLLFSTTESEQFTFAQVMVTDTALTQAWICTDDATNLDGASTTSLAYQLKTAKHKVHLEYFATTARNSAMVQLGKTLSKINATGFSVGEALDYLAVSTIGGSGAAGVNLTETQMAALEAQYVGYWSTIGNNTGMVAMYGGKLMDGSWAGADWFVKFVEYCASVHGATFLTNGTHRRNDETYQALLTILTAQVAPFIQIGMISNFKITAPKFAALPKSGDSFIVPGAWTADYSDSVRSTNIQGNLNVVL